MITRAGGQEKLQTSLGAVKLPFDSATLEQLQAVDYGKYFAVVVFHVDGFYPGPRLEVTRVAVQGSGLMVYSTFDGTIPSGPMPAADALHHHIVAVEKAPDVEWGREISVRLNVNGKEVQEQRFFIP